MNKEQQLLSHTSRLVAHSCFQKAQRVIRYFENADVTGPFVNANDDFQAKNYDILTTTMDAGVLSLIGNALHIVSPRAKLFIIEPDTTRIVLPIDKHHSGNAEFPLQQIESALDIVRNDLFNAMRQHKDGTITIDTAKIKHVKPENAFNLVHRLLSSHAKHTNENMRLKAEDNEHDLPSNIRYLQPSQNPKRPFEGDFHSRINHTNYVRTLEHQARAEGKPMTDELPEKVDGTVLTMDRAACAAIIKELGDSRQMTHN